MSDFKCHLCLEEFTNQFKFFEHLKIHYDVVATQPVDLKEPGVVECKIEDTKIPVTVASDWSNPLIFDREEKAEINEDGLIIVEELDGTLESAEKLEEESSDKSLTYASCQQCNIIFKRRETYEAHLSICEKRLLEGDFAEDEKAIKPIEFMEMIDANGCMIDTPIGIDGKITDEIIKKIDNQAEFLACGHLCAICDEFFPSRNKHDAHVKKSHPEVNKLKKKKSPGERRSEVLKCEDCNRVFNHRNSLVYHMRSHTGERPHKCELCDKSFFATSALKVHMRLHSGEKPYKCDHCERYFRQWGDLKYHVISIHSDIRQYQCEFCGKDFARKYSLIVHRRIHTGERNYKCEFCGKCFRAASYLQNHRRIHTGEKPHACTICSKPFRVRSDMKRHLTSHNRDQNTHGRTNPNSTPSVRNNVPSVPSLNNASQEITIIGSQQMNLQESESFQVSTREDGNLVNGKSQISTTEMPTSDPLYIPTNEEQHQSTTTNDDQTTGNLSIETTEVTSLQPSSIQESSLVFSNNRQGSLDTVTIRDGNSGIYIWPVHFMH